MESNVNMKAQLLAREQKSPRRGKADEAALHGCCLMIGSRDSSG